MIFGTTTFVRYRDGKWEYPISFVSAFHTEWVLMLLQFIWLVNDRGPFGYLMMNLLL